MRRRVAVVGFLLVAMPAWAQTAPPSTVWVCASTSFDQAYAVTGSQPPAGYPVYEFNPTSGAYETDGNGDLIPVQVCTSWVQVSASSLGSVTLSSGVTMSSSDVLTDFSWGFGAIFGMYLIGYMVRVAIRAIGMV